jgi:integrase
MINSQGTTSLYLLFVSLKQGLTYVKLTPLTISELKPTGKRYIITDDGHKGFAVKVDAKGSVELLYRYKESGRIHEMPLGKDYHQAFPYYLSLHAERKRRLDPKPPAPLPAVHLVTDSIFLDGIDFPTLCTMFIRDHVSARLSRQSGLSYGLHIERVLAATKGTDLYRGTAGLREARLELKKVLQKQRETAPIQANRMHSSLSSLFNWAITSDHVLSNPVFKIPKSPEKPKRRLLDDDGLREIFKVYSDSSFSINTIDALYLVLLTGMRAGEILDIRPSYINLEEKRLTLPAASVKNGREHLVALSGLAVRLLKKHMALVKGDKPLFTTSVYGLAQVARRAADRAGVTVATTHDYRRTMATMCGRLGVPVETISRILNHAVLGVTLRHYALHSGENEKLAALELVAAHLESLGIEV